jgi:hypothetical protein
MAVFRGIEGWFSPKQVACPKRQPMLNKVPHSFFANCFNQQKDHGFQHNAAFAYRI